MVMPNYPIQAMSSKTHPIMYGQGWRWVLADASTNEPIYCFKCKYGGPVVEGRATPSPSGAPIAYTYYKPAPKPYAHYSCETHYDGTTTDPGYISVPGVWVVQRIVDKRGIPVDRGHLHPETDYYMVHEPNSRAKAQGAMASTPGGFPCPWCNSSCTEEGRTYIAVCDADPMHRVEWMPWGG